MGRYELDPEHPEKIPAPQMGNHIARAIENLLPRNIFGEPQLIAEWGMDATVFRNGDPKSVKYIALHHRTITQKWRRLDPIEGKYEYFDTRKEAVEALNIRLLPHLERKPTKEVRLYGAPRWHIAQWFPCERIDSRKNWERNRHASYTNRKGELVKLDALGPYPERGQYREVMLVENPDGSFRDLDEALLRLLTAMISSRELQVQNKFTDGQAIRDTIAEAKAVEAAEEKAIEDEFESEVGVSRYRLIEGNAFSGYAGSSAQQAAALKK